MNDLRSFMLARAVETRPEVRCDLHDKTTFEMAEEVSKLLPSKGDVLDVGAGQGPALEWFTRNGFKVLGITTNQEDRIVCQNHGYTCLDMDQNDMPELWTESFDLVWARHVLEHSIAPFWTLSEFARVLRPNGILYAEMPAPNTSAVHESNGNHYSVMDWKMWLELIHRSGFRVIEAKQMQLHIPNLGADLYFSFICRRL